MWPYVGTLLAQATEATSLVVRHPFDTAISVGLMLLGVILILVALFRVGTLQGADTRLTLKDRFSFAAGPFGVIVLAGIVVTGAGMYVWKSDYGAGLLQLQGAREQLEEARHGLESEKARMQEATRVLQEATAALQHVTVPMTLDFGENRPSDPDAVEVHASVLHGNERFEEVPIKIREPGGIRVTVGNLHTDDRVTLTATDGRHRWKSMDVVVPTMPVKMTLATGPKVGRGSASDEASHVRDPQ